MSTRRATRPALIGLIALLLALLCVQLLPANAEVLRYDISFFDVFDTFSRVSVYTDNKEQADEWLSLSQEEFVTYHKLYDIYNEYEGMNNLCTVNRLAATEPVVVDERIFSLLTYAKEMYTLTGGRTNVAMGSVLALWHDARTAAGENPNAAYLPDMEALKAAAQHTSIDALVLDSENSTVFFTDPKLRLDVGAIAKGYATERVAQLLSERGVTSALLSIGGNIRAIGVRGDGQPYRAAVQNPDLTAENQALMVLPLDGQSLVTSGSYQRYYTVDGVDYHHIIDPDTLMPADYLVSVSVLTKDAGLADALSTALFTLDTEKGQALIASLSDTYAVWVLKDGTIIESANLPK